jgi:hypothetical protein
MITFRLATEEDANAVGGSLREVDRLEILRGTGHDPITAPAVAVQDSLIAWSAVNGEGRVVAVFGVAPHSVPQVGVVWLLATPEAEHETRAFLAKGRYYVGLMAKLYPTLMNWVDSENTRTRRWLNRLGFVEGEPRPGRLTGHLFIPVTYSHV